MNQSQKSHHKSTKTSKVHSPSQPSKSKKITNGNLMTKTHKTGKVQSSKTKHTSTVSINKNSNNGTTHTQISITRGQNNKQFSITVNTPTTAKKVNKVAGGTLPELNQAINSSIETITYSRKHFAILFDGARLLSANNIFNILERTPYNIFNYKKLWHTKIKMILQDLSDAITHNIPYVNCQYSNNVYNKPLPLFKCNVEVTLYHSTQNMVDRDALSIMFKYIIDAFKNNEQNPYGLLVDDNPAVIRDIKLLSEHGAPKVGIRFEVKNNKPVKSMKDTLLKQCN